MLRAQTPDRRKPGHIPGRTPRAFCVLARHEVAFALPLCPQSAALSSAAWREWMGAGEEQSYRLYSCRRCARQVRICRRCDRGNQYCAGECAGERRRESLRRAGARYQLSFRGACCHAARQRRWRMRRGQKVTHQGSPQGLGALIVAARLTATAGTHVQNPSVTAFDAAERPDAWRVWVQARCSFCGRRLPRFARWGFLRGGP
jgi:hypothetical protein